jgi:hypothetical protein
VGHDAKAGNGACFLPWLRAVGCCMACAGRRADERKSGAPPPLWGPSSWQHAPASACSTRHSLRIPICRHCTAMAHVA